MALCRVFPNVSWIDRVRGFAGSLAVAENVLSMAAGCEALRIHMGKVGYYVALVVSDSVNSNELGWAGVGWKVRCTWRGKTHFEVVI